MQPWGPEQTAKTLFLKFLFHPREFHWPIQKTVKKIQKTVKKKKKNVNRSPIPAQKPSVAAHSPNKGIYALQSLTILAFPTFPCHSCAPSSPPHTPAPTCQPPPSPLHVLGVTATPTRRGPGK